MAITTPKKIGVESYGKRCGSLKMGRLYKNQLAKEKLLFQIAEKPYYLTWWVISDVSREHREVRNNGKNGMLGKPLKSL